MKFFGLSTRESLSARQTLKSVYTSLYHGVLLHPSADIIGAKGDELADRKVVLGITGSVAAVKCVELARELMRHGAEVRAVMSPSATELITPKLMHWATGNPVVSELTGRIEHIELAKWGDLVLVAPTTANTLGKIANAIDDTPVTSVVSVALGLQKPILLVPAMHGSMYSSKFVEKNISKVRGAGMYVLEPRLEEDKAKLPSVGEITDFAMSILGPKDMSGTRVLVTAGPTIEYIDPVKFITNRSSGKMGIAIAHVAAARGAEVTLVYGPGTERPPENVRTIRVERTAEMRDVVIRELQKGQDIVIGTAAAQDFVVETPVSHKLKHFEPREMRLVPAPRILNGVRDLVPKAFVIGFKAECGVSDEQLLDAAKKKLEEDRLDMVVANDVTRPGAGFGTDTNDVLILTSSGNKRMKASKLEIARAILDIVIRELQGRR